MGTRSDTCVLLSGGVDSAVVLAMIADRSPTAVWVYYGQPSAAAERKASKALAGLYAVPWSTVQISGLNPPAAGVFPARNDLLVAAARTAAGGSSVAVGVHAGTGYADCSPVWATAWQSLLDAQDGGRTGLIAPLLELTKADVLRLARDLAVPLAITHSCEASSVPCGRCSSCMDRRGVDALA